MGKIMASRDKMLRKVEALHKIVNQTLEVKLSYELVIQKALKENCLRDHLQAILDEQMKSEEAKKILEEQT